VSRSAPSRPLSLRAILRGAAAKTDNPEVKVFLLRFLRGGRASGPARKAVRR
jgi:hypothetical protein